MLRVTIDIHPFDDESRARTLTTLDIWNTGDGTGAVGNYGYRLIENESWPARKREDTIIAEGQVKNWDRSRPVDVLVMACIRRAREGK